MSNQTDSLISTHGLTKKYGLDRGAIDINIEINPGEIVGFIGPNGAGKTTTMRMLMGFIKPASGNFDLFGKEINYTGQVTPLLGQIGYLPGEVNYYSQFTGRQLLRYAARFSTKNYDTQINSLAESFDLDPDRRIRYLSLGNKKKIGIIHALLGNPKLLILDEPTNGLDPLVQQNVLNMVKEVRERGGGVFLSSHILSEVQQICDRIVMIKHGNIILQDKTADILERALKKITVLNVTKELESELRKLPDVQQLSKLAGDLIFYTPSAEAAIKLLTTNHKFEFYVERPNLEEMFMHLYNAD